MSRRWIPVAGDDHLIDGQTLTTFEADDGSGITLVPREIYRFEMLNQDGSHTSWFWRNQKGWFWTGQDDTLTGFYTLEAAANAYIDTRATVSTVPAVKIDRVAHRNLVRGRFPTYQDTDA